ncbi:MAG: patatin-like phospholipase family protein [Candidatus Promineofilum sp.]|nr:patatin-like phospholipase family protein [Promineifilum sp.]
MQFDLVFEGGGAKGMVFVGALEEFARRGHTFGRLLGTSAGAITATYLAAGFSVGEMLDALNEKDERGVSIFMQFLGRPRPFTPSEIAGSTTSQVLERLDIPFIPNFLESRIDRQLLNLMSYEELIHFFAFIERGGWYSGEAFIMWAQSKLDQPTPDGHPRQLGRLTFAEFYVKTGRELSLIAADTTARRLLVLNHRTAPRLPVVWAMRMSMSLPLVWEEVIWQEEWGNYLNRAVAGHRIVDGGLLSNFPMELFISGDPHVQAIMGPKISQGILGLLIDERLPVPGAEIEPRPPGGSMADLSPVRRIIDLAETATQAHDKMVIEAFEQFVCRLPAEGYGTIEFNMTDDRREKLIAAGNAAMSRYFRTRETQGMKGPDIHEMERALNRADRIAGKLLQ